MTPSNSDDRDRYLPPVLLVLTAVTGVVDAVSYLGLGRVFTANMTGNVVLLGFAAAGVQDLSVTRSGMALLAFFAGAVVGGRAAKGMSALPWYRWTRFAFGAEAMLFFIASAFAAFSVSVAPVYPVIVLTGLAMGIRNATVRKLAVPDLTTTVLTLTITGLAVDSFLAGGSHKGFRRRSASVVLLLAGAALGAWMVDTSLSLPLAVCGVASGSCALAVSLAPALPLAGPRVRAS